MRPQFKLAFGSQAPIVASYEDGWVKGFALTSLRGCPPAAATMTASDTVYVSFFPCLSPSRNLFKFIGGSGHETNPVCKIDPTNRPVPPVAGFIDRLRIRA